MNTHRLRFCTLLIAVLALVVTLLPPASAQTYPLNWTGYSQLPNTGTTPSSPNSVVYQGNLYIFTRGYDNHIHYNVFNGSWSSYQTVPYGANTSSAPKPIVFNGLLYVFTRGYSDSKLWYNSFDGTSWSTYQQVPGNATVAAEPTVVIEYGQLTLTNQGQGDGKFYLTQTSDPAGYWTPYTELPPNGGTSASQLGSAVFTSASGISSQWFTFFRGAGNNINYTDYSVYNDGSSVSAAWSNYYLTVPGNVYTDSGPVPLSYNGGVNSPANNDLLLFFKGVGSGQVNYSIFNEATNLWFGPFQIPYGSYSSTVSTGIAPGAVVYNNSVLVFQRGSDNRIYFAQGTF